MKLQGGPEEVLKMLQMMADTEREKLMDSIAARDPKLADYLKQNLIQFSDILFLSTSQIRILLTEVKAEWIGLACRKEGKEVLEYIAEQVSSGIKRDMMDTFNGPPQSMSKVEEAKKNVMTVMKKQIDEGAIYINRKGDDPLV